MPTMWDDRLQHAQAWTMRSGQRSALTRVNVSKGVAHRAQNPGGQNAHTVLALLGQQDAASRDLNADHSAAKATNGCAITCISVSGTLQGPSRGPSASIWPLSGPWTAPRTLSQNGAVCSRPTLG